MEPLTWTRPLSSWLERIADLCDPPTGKMLTAHHGPPGIQVPETSRLHLPHEPLAAVADCTGAGSEQRTAMTLAG